ncbi:VOC family protein [Protofrankia sp. BMG5.30]|uniref:VOC family protein n=1 Tax=Protofrankia sp. BMG5.30 TaxID=1834514 RepID=UPI0009780B44|nr:VOC family protein [Protofrankia sp. BMG5.30]ONH34534.1 glyoxalase [Protofrankia sp. BMG5.30]
MTFQVTFDCADPAALSAFWADALGYEAQPPPPGLDSWPAFLAARGVPAERWNSAAAIVDPSGVGPRVFFQRVPEPKTAKNRVHLDLQSGGALDVSLDVRRARTEQAVARLEKLGATRVRAVEELGVYWVVMRDPEGNEFCA